jgi:hypothetical protein
LFVTGRQVTEAQRQYIGATVKQQLTSLFVGD